MPQLMHKNEYPQQYERVKECHFISLFREEYPASGTYDGHPDENSCHRAHREHGETQNMNIDL
jgi:hypothetical protein